MPRGEIAICYFDTSFTTKLYVSEKQSEEAVDLAASLASEVAISTLIDLEMASMIFRQMESERANRIYAIYEANRRSGAYDVLSIDDAVLLRARRLAEVYGGSLKLKSLDILHLATALHYGVTAMAVYDNKLRTGAEAMGLKVVPERS